MLELIVTVLITLSSALLFGYWFRYTCLLILSARTTRDYAVEIAQMNQLSFLQVQAELRSQPVELDKLQAALDRDYATISNLIQSSSGDWGMEDRMLQLNYRLMGAGAPSAAGSQPRWAGRLWTKCPPSSRTSRTASASAPRLAQPPKQHLLQLLSGNLQTAALPRQVKVLTQVHAADLGIVP
jgi:hypothetical protein